MKRLVVFRMLSLMLLVAVVISCAKQMTIGGGPKDVVPPHPKTFSPENGSVNFQSRRINIRFDEYVRLNSLNQKLIVSPPLSAQPNIFVQGKSVCINLKHNELQPNTTYCFNFNDAIVDNNEGNALNSFVYAFSTGEHIDSLMFTGRVLDAFTKNAVADAWVVLYNNLADTAVNTLPPSYVTKVDKNGDFKIPFVKDDNYKIYAIKDNNFNYMFDLPDESIAFLDTVYHPDTQCVTGDSATAEIRYSPADVKLLLFKEDRQMQYVVSHCRPKPNSCEVVFVRPQNADFRIEVIGDTAAIVMPNARCDTVDIRLTADTLLTSENVNIVCHYTDPLFADTLRHDTLSFAAPQNAARDSVCTLKVKTTKTPPETLRIAAQNPVKLFSINKMQLLMKSDTTFVDVPFELQIDSLDPTKINVEAAFLEKTDYKIIVADSCIADIYDLYNVADTFAVATKASAEYGGLKIFFSDKQTTHIVQLLVGEKVKYQQSTRNGCVTISYITPAKYVIRVIADENDNKRWDTGDYKLQKQPERVFFYPTEYEIKENWSHEIEWKPDFDEPSDSKSEK